MEHETFREVYKVRDEIKTQFTKQEKSVNSKKESLFKNSKDLKKWGYDGDGGLQFLESNIDKIMLNKDVAFTYMI